LSAEALVASGDLGEGGTMDYFTDKNPDLKLHDQPIEQIDPT
jgi:hypothetical protein